MPVDICSPAIGPFCGVVLKFSRTIGKTEYLVLIYRSYNAMGLIGSEFNGIAVLNDTEKTVVTDNIERCINGYEVPTKKQIDVFKKMRNCTPEEFRDIVNNSPRLREGQEIGV